MAAQKTIECSVCNHVIAASMVFDDSASLDSASPALVASMAAKYLLLKGASWGTRLSFFTVVWLCLYPLITAVGVTAFLGYPHQFIDYTINRMKLAGGYVGIPQSDDSSASYIVVTVIAFWMVGVVVQVVFVPVVLGALMWVRFCTEAQDVIPGLRVEEERRGEEPEDGDVEGVVPVDGEAPDVGDHENEEGEAGHPEQQPHILHASESDEESSISSECGQLPDNPNLEETPSLKPQPSVGSSSEPPSIEAATLSDNNNGDPAAVASSPVVSSAYTPQPAPRKLVQLRDKAAIIAALKNADAGRNGEDEDQIQNEEEFFASVLGLTGKFVFSVGIFVLMVCILLGALGLVALPIFAWKKIVVFCARNGAMLASSSSSKFDIPILLSDGFLDAFLEYVTVGTDRGLMLASVLSSTMLGSDVTAFFAQLQQSPQQQLVDADPLMTGSGETSAVANILMWMLSINIGAKIIMRLSKGVAPASIKPFILMVVAFVNGVLGKVTHLFLATFGASVIVALVLSDAFVGTDPSDGSLIVTPEHAFSLVGGAVKVPFCGTSSPITRSNTTISFTATIASLRILQTNPLPSNTCGNYFDFSECSQEQRDSSAMVKRYLTYSGAFDEEEKEVSDVQTPENGATYLPVVDVPENVSMTTVWSGTAHPDQTRHPLATLTDPFSLAVMTRDISVGRHVTSVLLLGYTTTTFTFAAITFLQECIHSSFLLWLFPVPPHGSQGEFLLTRPTRSQLLPLMKSLGIIIVVQCMFVRTACHVVMEAFWAADLFPLVISDGQCFGIGVILMVCSFVADPSMRLFQRAFARLISAFDLQTYLVLGQWPQGDFALELLMRVTLLCGTMSLLTVSVLSAMGSVLASLHLTLSSNFAYARSWNGLLEDIGGIAWSVVLQLGYQLGLNRPFGLETRAPTPYTHSSLVDYLSLSSDINVDTNSTWPPSIYSRAPHASAVTSAYISLRATHAIAPFILFSSLALWFHYAVEPVGIFLELNVRGRLNREVGKIRLLGLKRLTRFILLKVRLVGHAKVSLRFVKVTRANGDTHTLINERLRVDSGKRTHKEEKRHLQLLNVLSREVEDGIVRADIVLSENTIDQLEAELPLHFVNGAIAIVAVLCEVALFVALMYGRDASIWSLFHLVHVTSLPSVREEILDALRYTPTGGLFGTFTHLIKQFARRQFLVDDRIPMLVSAICGPGLWCACIMSLSFDLRYWLCTAQLLGLETLRASRHKPPRVQDGAPTGRMWGAVSQFATRYFNEKHCQGIIIHDAQEDGELQNPHRQ